MRRYATMAGICFSKNETKAVLFPRRCGCVAGRDLAGGRGSGSREQRHFPAARQGLGQRTTAERGAKQPHQHTMTQRRQTRQAHIMLTFVARLDSVSASEQSLIRPEKNRSEVKKVQRFSA